MLASLSRRKAIEHRLLRRGVDAPAGVVDSEVAAETREGRPRQLACATCLTPITSTSARIVVAGDHEHTFSNPEGVRFHIGCFSAAANCTLVGPPSSYWTWFPPYRWQVEICANCRRHLGWLFRSTGDSFHGLILDRLVELMG